MFAPILQCSFQAIFLDSRTNLHEEEDKDINVGTLNMQYEHQE